MFRRTAAAALLLWSLHVSGGAYAQQPDIETIPAPRLLVQPPVQPAIPLYYPPPVTPRSIYETRDVWRFYATDQFGYLRPRVVLSPFGSYYLGNGQPYPWVTSDQRLFMPMAAD